MTTLAANDNRPDLDENKFEDTYKQSYTHGLESIYALETIDPKSIRPMTNTIEEVENKEEIKVSQEFHDPQLEFDLGTGYRKWVEPFFLEEPIQVLGLSVLAENGLKDHGKREIRDLLEGDFEKLAELKGIGQGHLDEIRQALTEYIRGRSTECTYSVDFMGWVRSIVGALDRKKVKVALEPYGLSESVTLTPSEEIEVRKTNFATKRQWTEEIYQKILTPSFVEKVKRDFNRLIQVFVKPWVQGRGGIALKRELQERLERVAEKESLALPALRFLDSVYFSDSSPYANFLVQIDRELYASEQKVSDLYRDTIARAKTYFYIPTACYKFEELMLLIQREYSKEWKEAPSGFFERVFKISPQFRTRKGERGDLIVRLS